MVKFIFMIDDDEDDREIFREAVLSYDADVEVLFARDGVEALDILNSSWVRPDVIFLDYNMPRMNGIDCLKKLRENKITKGIPVVMYTTSGDQAQENAILGLGANYYMRKSHSFRQLCDELNRLLDSISPRHTELVVRGKRKM